ncbi:hypothetical protein ACTXL1_06945 [Psychrobacter celer]|uniref:hypothetical protein n=1 Tax=Psychrobacter celer TaxID=306572 RepID=UPI003FCEF54F
MAILATSGRAAIATAIKNNTLHLAWGTGLPDWDNALPPELRTATQLTTEIGRRVITVAQYCSPSPDGSIVTLGGRFKPSTTPTANLHLQAAFDFDDGLGETIRELGVFIGTETKPGLPAGQTYFKPAHIVNKGTLLTIDHITGIERGVGSRISFDVVVTF